MHRTHLPIRIWFWATYLVTTHTPGISALQLQRQLGISKIDSAWFLLHRLRQGVVRNDRSPLSGLIEADEAYIGRPAKGKKGRGVTELVNKTLILGAVEVKIYRNKEGQSEEKMEDLDINKKIWNHELSISNQTYEPFLEVIANLVARENYKRIVDFGCGNGMVGRFLRESFGSENIELFAADISETALEKSRPYYDHVFLKEDCLLPNGQFDLVVLNGVIEHICDVNLQILFSDIIRKLLPNGAIFVTVPNNFSPQILLQRLTKTIRPDLEVGHVNLKTKSEWKEFFRGFGFRNFKFSYFLALKHSKVGLLIIS